MPYDKFKATINPPDGISAWDTFAGDLRYLSYLVREERPLNYDYSRDIYKPDSLLAIHEEVRRLFLGLHRKTTTSEGSDSDSLSLASADSGLLAQMKKDAEEAVATGVTNFWLQSLKEIDDTLKFKISVRDHIWENRRTGGTGLKKVTVLFAVQSLVNYLNSFIDLEDNTEVAMWVLDAEPDTADDSVLTYDIESRRKLRAAFKTIHDAFSDMGQLIKNIYENVEKYLKDPLEQNSLFEIETVLRRLQHFCYTYAKVFK
ncbi:hypothetical protein ABW20_dc0105011 [Dactylellina cionopaga]|nr:hypothetical protein ABW20_dc0105011 [Dactylellina cionopaga]